MMIQICLAQVDQSQIENQIADQKKNLEEEQLLGKEQQ